MELHPESSNGKLEGAGKGETGDRPGFKRGGKKNSKVRNSRVRNGRLRNSAARQEGAG
jgi:hypothetical protein